MNTRNFEFTNEVIVRNPAYQFANVDRFISIPQLLKNNQFLEAIYLASPTLHAQCLKFIEGKLTEKKDEDKLYRSVTKYYTRMYSRCTPFGLFSGSGVVEWSDQHTNIKSDAKHWYRRTRLDMFYLCHLAETISKLPFIQRHLLYFTNNSHYIIGKEIRYIESKFLNARRKFSIAGIKVTPLITHVLEKTKAGAKIDDLIKIVTRYTSYTYTDSQKYIIELINSQLLTSEIEPAITGPEFIHQIIATLKTMNDEQGQIVEIIRVLERINLQLTLIDQENSHDVNSYKELIEIIKLLGIPLDEGKLFQVDSFIQFSSDKKVNSTIQADILNGFDVLNSLNYHRNNEKKDLILFAKRFKEKYEDRHVPLLEVLDADYGIGYPVTRSSHYSPLVDDLILTEAKKPITVEFSLSKVDLWLHEQIIKSEHEGRNQIEITTDLLGKYKAVYEDLPPSLSAIFRILDDDKIHLEYVTGPSAINILARFCHGNSQIKELSKHIAIEEQRLNDQTCFAEIVHLPDNRASNVILHPPFRDFEIPYLSKSSLSQSNQLNADDIKVTVVNNEIILIHKLTNKPIVPRLSSMHNFFQGTLPLYHFLGDLQYQHYTLNFHFNWGRLAYLFKHFPRLVSGKVILSPERWMLTNEDIHDLKSLDDNKINVFRNTWKLPQFILYVEGDNDLLVDFSNQHSVAALLDAIGNKTNVIFLEFLFEPKKSCVEINQCIASIINTKSVFMNRNISNNIDRTIKRKLQFSDQWVYYKLYCGASTANDIMVNAIYPMIKQLSASSLITKWFFVKYSDPDFHIRLRINYANSDDFGIVNQALHSCIDQYIHDEIVWKVQTETYVREIERYGANSIVQSEELFYHDSESTVTFLSSIKDINQSHIKWLWGLRSMDALFNSFNFSIDEKRRVVGLLRTNYSKEFHMDKSLIDQINKKFRRHEKILKQILNESEGQDFPDLIDAPIKERTKAILPLVSQILTLKDLNQLNVDFNHLIASYIHMMFNRLLDQKARLMELVLYEFMGKFYDYKKFKVNKLYEDFKIEN